MFLFLRHYVIFVKASSVFYPYCYRTVCNQCVSKSFFLVVQVGIPYNYCTVYSMVKYCTVYPSDEDSLEGCLLGTLFSYKKQP